MEGYDNLDCKLRYYCLLGCWTYCCWTRYLRVDEVGVADLDAVDVDVDELAGVGPAAEHEGAGLDAPGPVGEVERTESPVKDKHGPSLLVNIAPSFN